MAFDLILRNARIAGIAPEAPLMDIAIQGETIVTVEPHFDGEGEERDVGGLFVSPGLIETHIHLDKSCIMDRCTAAPDRGTDHMARVAAVKPGFTQDDVYARAQATLEQCLVNGASHMRTHVELDPNVGLRGFEALKQLAVDYRWAIDIEICVFAQEGWTNAPETDANIVAALQNGATVVGGAPGYDPDHGGQIRRIFELARDYDVDVDIHLDVGPTIDGMDIHLVCELTEVYGWGGRVAVGHGTKYPVYRRRNCRPWGGAWPIPVLPSPCCRRRTCLSWAGIRTTASCAAWPTPTLCWPAASIVLYPPTTS